MSKKKILVVDDDKDLLRGIGIRLKASGYDTVFATDGSTAIAVAQREKPDLIILDIGLPAGDGFMVIERLTGLVPVAFIPIIILSARDPAVWKKKSLDAGARAFFQKPADHKEILSVIREILGEDGGSDQAKEDKSSLSSEDSTNAKKILLVDDNTNLLRSLIRLLRHHGGYNVFFATDALQAIQTFKKQKPDLVLLDIGLPGADGFMVMDSLRSIEGGANVPIIIMSGLLNKDNRERALFWGAMDLLEKPVDDQKLLSAIQQALRNNEDNYKAPLEKL